MSQITTTWQLSFTFTCGLSESRKKTQAWPTTIIFHSPHFFILTASFARGLTEFTDCNLWKIENAIYCFVWA